MGVVWGSKLRLKEQSSAGESTEGVVRDLKNRLRVWSRAGGSAEGLVKSEVKSQTEFGQGLEYIRVRVWSSFRMGVWSRTEVSE